MISLFVGGGVIVVVVVVVVVDVEDRSGALRSKDLSLDRDTMMMMRSDLEP